jgi:hypothetical protein
MKLMHRVYIRQRACYAIAAGLALCLVSQAARACGLDWTLPQAHFAGVEEHGYVSYWEKIGEVDLGGNVVLPVYIGFNSRREASSPVLGKGWIVALLESHVEPIDENAMNVVMPDGWTFLFLRNGNTETWRGSAGWVGETDDSRFTITAPCGWKLKFDGGKIQEIDSDTGGTLTYGYNGGVPMEIDHDGHAVLQVERDAGSGIASALILGEQRIALALAQRPRIVALRGQNLIDGLDPSLSSLQWPDGKRETLTFGTDKSLNPTLTLNETGQPPRTFVWDATTRQIKTDGKWTYTLVPVQDHLRFIRTSVLHEEESYEANNATGMSAEKDADGPETVTWRFVNGPLAGLVRKVEQVGDHGARQPLYSASYYPSGEIMREIFYPDEIKMYSETRQLLKQTIGGRVIYEQDLDSQGRVVHILDATKDTEVKMTYAADGSRTTQVFRHGALFYTEQIDRDNKLVSLNEGDQ